MSSIFSINDLLEALLLGSARDGFFRRYLSPRPACCHGRISWSRRRSRPTSKGGAQCPAQRSIRSPIYLDRLFRKACRTSSVALLEPGKPAHTRDGHKTAFDQAVAPKGKIGRQLSNKSPLAAPLWTAPWQERSEVASLGRSSVRPHLRQVQCFDRPVAAPAGITRRSADKGHRRNSARSAGSAIQSYRQLSKPYQHPDHQTA